MIINTLAMKEEKAMFDLFRLKKKKTTKNEEEFLITQVKKEEEFDIDYDQFLRKINEINESDIKFRIIKDCYGENDSEKIKTYIAYTDYSIEKLEIENDFCLYIWIPDYYFNVRPHFTLFFRIKNSNNLIIDDIHSEKENCGLGSMGIKILIELLEEIGYKKVKGILSPVDKINFEKLEYFYIKNGFSVVFDKERTIGEITYEIK